MAVPRRSSRRPIADNAPMKLYVGTTDRGVSDAISLAMVLSPYIRPLRQTAIGRLCCVYF
jgi:hypothetical protein